MDELVQAVISGDLRALSLRLCSAPHLVNRAIDDEQTTLLHLAANSSLPAILKLLLSHGAMVNWQNEEGVSALHVAAMWGNETGVQLLLDSGADPVVVDEEDMTPLDHALSQGHDGCVKLLWSACGLECSMVEDDGNGAEVNMSMAEAFVSMFSDEFTQVTQLSPELGSSSCVTQRAPPTSGAALHKTSNGATRPDSPFKVPGDPVTCNGVALTYKSPLASYGSPLARNGASDSAPHTPINNRLSHNVYDSPNLTPTNPSPPITPGTPITPTSLANTPTNEPSQHCAASQQHTTAPPYHADKEIVTVAKNPRRELFPDSTDTSRSKENTDPSMLYVTTADRAYFDDTIDAVYLEDTIILENPVTPPSLLPHQPSTSVESLCSKVASAHIHLTDVSNTTAGVDSGKDRSMATSAAKEGSSVTTNAAKEGSSVTTKKGSSVTTNAVKVKGQGHSLSRSGDVSMSGNHSTFVNHRSSMDQSRSDSHNVSVCHDQSKCDSSVVLVSVSPPSWIVRLSNGELREKLLSLGEHPGPVDDSTRAAYQVYLAKVQAGVQPRGNRGYKGYKYELALVLNGTAPIPDLNSLEQQVFQSFRQTPAPSSSGSLTPHSTPRQKTPRGRPPISHSSTPGRNRTPSTPGRNSTTPGSARKVTKDHFNYLLLDPVELDRLHSAASELERFRVFVESVFYVGKGKNSRSAQHLKDASNCGSKSPAKVSAKLRRILNVWSRGRGIVSLHMFNQTTAEEAFTREACLIETIGLDMLTNVQRGHVYGEVCGWRMCKRRKLGVHLLHKAFRAYLLDTPQEIFQHDL